MSLFTIAQIVFFLTIGISQFVPFKYSDILIGVSAIIIGFILLFGKV